MVYIEVITYFFIFNHYFDAFSLLFDMLSPVNMVHCAFEENHLQWSYDILFQLLLYQPNGEFKLLKKYFALKK